MRNKKSIIISMILMLVPFILAAIFYNKLPDELPTHFSFDNSPDKFEPKFHALFFMPCIMVLLQGFMLFMLNKDPRKKYQNEKMYGVSLFIIPIISIIVALITINYGMGNKINIGQIVMIAISILIIVLGNLMPKCKRNYTMGIRNQWTLSSDYIWEKTHRFGGFAYVLAGISGLVVSIFFSHFGSIAGLIIILVVTAIPSIYSYILYEKERKRE